MNEFMLIFRHEDGQKVASPEQIQEWMKQTMDWIGGVAAQNKFVSGDGLPFDDARVVHHDKSVTNGPFGDIKETIGGTLWCEPSLPMKPLSLPKVVPYCKPKGIRLKSARSSERQVRNYREPG